MKKRILVVFNPSAGKGSHSKVALSDLFSSPGTDVCIISKDDPNWMSALDKRTDTLIIAGGDGTVHTIASEVIKNKWRTPLRILPLGTANNISKALEQLKPDAYDSHGILLYDVGRISGLPKNEFFIESLGLGLFPRFMEKIKKDSHKEFLKMKFKDLIEFLIKTIEGYKPKITVITADGIKMKGNYLLLEIFNIQYIGPNINLAQQSIPNDGFFDLGIIPVNRKAQFIEYLSGLAIGKPDQTILENLFLRFRLKKIKIVSVDRYLHIDDELIEEYSGGSIKVKLLPGRLKFLKSPGDVLRNH